MILSFIYGAQHIVQYYGNAVGTFDVEIGGFKADFMDLTAQEMKKLKKNAKVKRVKENGHVEAYGIFGGNGGIEIEDTLQWNLDRIDVRKGYDKKYTYPDNGGEGITVYVVDTGTTVDHIEFENRASWGYDFTGEGQFDAVGHGTHVAGIVAGKTFGVAKKATIIAVKTLTYKGGNEETVIKGLEWVVNHYKARKTKALVNLSLGSEFSQTMNDAVDAVIGAGIPVIAAAGNSQKDACGYSPASLPSAITVAATDRQDIKAAFSNWGTCIDINAPGLAITSAWKGAGNKINALSGTSMAAPHVVFYYLM